LSSVEIAASLVKKLKYEEWRTLEGIEKCVLRFPSSSPGIIARTSHQPLERVLFAIDRLNKSNLVTRQASNYAITTAGLDALALKNYVDRNLLAALGAVIAKGKESDVYEAFTDGGELRALKVFRLGRISFRDVARKRAPNYGVRGWITKNYESAKREFKALKKLEPFGVLTPIATAYNRHTILLEEVAGVRMSQRPVLVDPDVTLREILKAIKVAFLRAGVINGDLSEYNILSDGKAIWMIDWPQSVDRTHPNASKLLERDVLGLLKFFKRAYGVTVTPDNALTFVRGISDKLTLKHTN
jgi:RIO kinase 2